MIHADDFSGIIPIQQLDGFHFSNIQVDIRRIDLIHPVVSGNKWYKLQYYLSEAISQNKETIASFGGAYSNHIVASAFVASSAGLKSVGVIRGERPMVLSETLQDAIQYGMELHFVSREEFDDKDRIINNLNKPGHYWIKEGGYGQIGANGASEILAFPELSDYSHIICATGTGTMMAGLIKGCLSFQEVIGISVLKNHLSLEEEVRKLLTQKENEKKCSFIHGYHFGGYAKHPEPLIDFMKGVWGKWQLPTDIVYTSKLLYAVKDLLEKRHFPVGSKILIIHSGGIQGNRSLVPGTIPF